jgi:hypothetical protein
MKTRPKPRVRSEQEIDRIAVAQAGTDARWEKPIRVRSRTGAAVLLSRELASRAAFFARIHRERSVASWLRRIVQERLNLEEAALADVRRVGAKRSA